MVTQVHQKNCTTDELCEKPALTMASVSSASISGINHAASVKNQPDLDVEDESDLKEKVFLFEKLPDEARKAF